LLRVYGSKLPTCRWARHYSRWLFAFPAAGNWAAITGQIFFPPAVVLGLGMAITVAPADHDRYELDRAKPRWTASGVNNAVARTASLIAIASPWRRNASRVRNQSGSQIEHYEFAGVSRTIAANSIDKTRGHRHSWKCEPRNAPANPSRNR